MQNIKKKRQLILMVLIVNFSVKLHEKLTIPSINTSPIYIGVKN